MNKVINIEVAKQVFWIEEQGYKVLSNYLDKLKLQLSKEECGDDIFLDIELRLAELMYGLNTGKDRAITMTQLMDIIEQVGFVDGEELELEVDTTRKIYLDAQNQILAGVCAGLSMRVGIPTFILRVMFIGLIFAFGFGVLLYLIFWLSFEKNNTRNSALSAQGKMPTAKRIAAGTDVEISPFLKLQRVLFLPFTLLGAIFNIVSNSFIAKRSTYVFLIKNILLIAAIFLLITMSMGIISFNEDQIFPAWLQWILSAAAIYLMVLLSTIFIREYYLSKPHIKVRQALKKAAIFPIILICGSLSYLLSDIVDEKSTKIESDHLISSKTLTLNIREPDSDNSRARKVNVVLRTTQVSDKKLKISIGYFANGRGNQSLDKNIQGIDYKYSVNNDTLVLDRYFELQSNAFNRGQRISVLIEIPQNIKVVSSHNLRVNTQDTSVDYELTNIMSTSALYETSGAYFHEDNAINQLRLSTNERSVLTNKFCREFFQQPQWNCARNINEVLADNRKFKQAFIDESNEVEQIRLFLKPDKVIELKELVQINDLIIFLMKKYPDISELQNYTQHLLTVKHSETLSLKTPG